MSPRPDQGTGDACVICNLQMPVVRPETPPERLAKSVEIYGLLTGHRQARSKPDLSRARQTWTGKGSLLQLER
jgi:hypothetical protein